MNLPALRRTGALAALACLQLLASLPARAADAPKDIVDMAVGAGAFNTLAAALQAADLLGALKGEGPFTVFAPTDAAFAKLPAGMLEDLLGPGNQDKLKALLLHHVVPARVMVADMQGAAAPATLAGTRLDVTSGTGGTRVNGIEVIVVDVVAGNGVIHVIESVLLPPG